MSNTKTVAKVIFLATSLGVAVVPAASFAKGGQGPRVTFEELDANNDGQVTQEEMAARANARFTDTDTDGDGFLSKEEISVKAGQRAQQRLDRMFENRDANADGKLSIEEMSPPQDRMAKGFSRIDTDGNGSVSKEEFEAGLKMRKGPGRGQGKSRSN